MSDDQLRPYPCVVGVDLAATTDTCSVATVWALPDRKFYVKAHAWVCDAGVRKRSSEKPNLPQYRSFAQDGVMTIERGDANDYRLIKAYILSLKDRFDLRECVFDWTNANETSSNLMEAGITVYRMPQTHRHFTSPMKEFSIAIDEQRIAHDGNKYLRWCLYNTVPDVDSQGNQRPSRDKSRDKIDGSIACLMAYARCQEYALSKKPPSVYLGRGIVVL